MINVVRFCLVILWLLSGVVLAADLVSVNRFVNDSGNSDSDSPRITPNGRYVVFTSDANDLVLRDTNRASDVFVRDLQVGRTFLVSVNRLGNDSGRFGSGSPEITPDGRYVVFTSDANDLVPVDTNTARDVFVRDLVLGRTTLVSANRVETGSGNSDSDSPQITPNGRFVAFVSDASDLVVLDRNLNSDVFVRDLDTSTTTLVSVNLAGSGSGNFESDSPRITIDGRSVVFASLASNLVTGDFNFARDVFIRDLQTGETTLVSESWLTLGSGNSSSRDPRVSDDGRFVVFTSLASDLVRADTNLNLDVFVRDLSRRSTRLVSVRRSGFDSGNLASESAEISPDGRFVVFESLANNLVALDSNQAADVFVRDLLAEVTRLASVNRFRPDSGNSTSSAGQVTPDGQFVTFESLADNLVVRDTNDQRDVFVRDLRSDVTRLISFNRFGIDSANGSSGAPQITPDGKFVAFDSLASDIVLIDNNDSRDVFRARGDDVGFSIDYSITGSWFDPETNGQGFAFEVVPSLNFLVVYWFTFAPDGNQQMWLQGVGTIARDQASVPLFRPVDGRFDDPRLPVLAPWGNATVRFSSTGEGTVAFSSDVDRVSGNISIRRITADIACKEAGDPATTAIDAGITGSWGNPATDRQGFFLEVIPDTNQIVVYWFTYTVDGSMQMWLSGTDTIAGETATVALSRPEGGVFNSPPRPDFPQWGVVTVAFSSPTSGTVNYRSDLDDVTGTVPISRLTPLVFCD